MPPAPAIVGLGELLWDFLPGGRQLGGAPCNFAFHCHQLGHAAVMVSRVGTDPLGAELRATVHRLGLSDHYLQDDPHHPTGTVRVTMNEAGGHTFTITPDVAWDYLDWNDQLAALFAGCQAVCFGSLAQRHPVSRATIQKAVAAARHALTIFDVNLRQHYYSRDVLEASLTACRWVKLNDEELPVLRDLLGLGGSTEPELLRDLRRRYELEVAALTRGAKGCLLQSDEEEVSEPGVPVTVVDTVGAGDSFTAGLLVSTLEGRSLAEAARFANRLAARVAASAGGTPVIDRGELER